MALERPSTFHLVRRIAVISRGHAATLSLAWKKRGPRRRLFFTSYFFLVCYKFFCSFHFPSLCLAYFQQKPRPGFSCPLFWPSQFLICVPRALPANKRAVELSFSLALPPNPTPDLSREKLVPDPATAPPAATSDPVGHPRPSSVPAAFPSCPVTRLAVVVSNRSSRISTALSRPLSGKYTPAPASPC